MQASNLLSVFLASEMVCIGVLAEVGLLASGADLFERGASGGGSGRSLVGEDLFGKDFGGERGERCNSSLEVVAAGRSCQIGSESRRWMYSLPVALHVSALQVAGAEGDLTGVAGEGMGGTRCHASHDGCRRKWYTDMCGLGRKWRAMFKGRRSSRAR